MFYFHLLCEDLNIIKVPAKPVGRIVAALKKKQKKQICRPRYGPPSVELDTGYSVIQCDGCGLPDSIVWKTDYESRLCGHFPIIMGGGSQAFTQPHPESYLGVPRV